MTDGPHSHAMIGEVMDVVSPLHVTLTATGHIDHAGPTMLKIFEGRSLIGSRILEEFEVTRPRPIATMAELRDTAGQQLHLKMRRAPYSSLKGVFLAMGQGGVLAMSFGIRLADSVSQFNLTASDFAPTDLAVELLYLVEARNIVMDETDRLNARLRIACDVAEREALTDPLTGLGNRRALEQAVAALLLDREEFALMQIDLDHFKLVNDTQGHDAGDFVLKQVAEVLRKVTRSGDTVSRLGGDEFVVVFPGLRDGERLDDIAKRLILGIETPVLFGGELCRISASAGTTFSHFYPDPALDEMLKDADAALYASKNAGRGQHQMFQPPLKGPPH